MQITPAAPVHNNKQKDSGEDAPLEAVVDKAIEISENGDVSLRALLKAWGDRSYGPLFIVLGIVAGTPLAMIPGAAAIVGVIIFMLAIQMAFGKTHPWLPDIFLKQSVPEKAIRKVRRKIEPTLNFLDRLITERMTWAVNAMMRRLSSVIVAILGVVMIPFDAIPFAVAAPAWTIVLFGVSITARDGLVMLLAAGAFLLVAYLGLSML